jgi:hypothetical protein
VSFVSIAARNARGEILFTNGEGGGIVKCDKNTPVGTKVKMVNCLEAEKYAEKIWVTESQPWQLGSGAWIVLLEGYSGGFSIKCLEAVDEKSN